MMFAKVGLLMLTMMSGQGEAAKPTPAALISKAMARYSGVSSLAGRINLVQEARGVSVGIETTLQLDRPNRIYLRQVQSGSEPKTFLLVSDGKFFSYDKPTETLGKSRFFEAVSQRGGTQTVEDLYVASIRSMLERSPVMDLVMARNVDLRELKSHIGMMAVTETVTVDGETAYVIDGKWHDLPGAEATGTFRMVIDEDGDLRKMVRVQRFRIPDKLKETLLITSTWIVDVKVNGKTNDALYTVPR